MKRLIKNQKKSKLELEVQTFTLPVVYRHASADTYWKIFLTILKHQNERDLTKSLLSKEIGVSPSLVSRVIRHLTQLGLVKTEENYEIDGTSKMYLAVRTERIVYLLMMDRINDEQLAREYASEYEQYINDPMFTRVPSKLDFFPSEIKDVIVRDLLKEQPRILLCLSLLMELLQLEFNDEEAKQQETGLNTKRFPQPIIAILTAISFTAMAETLKKIASLSLSETLRLWLKERPQVKQLASGLSLLDTIINDALMKKPAEQLQEHQENVQEFVGKMNELARQLNDFSEKMKDYQKHPEKYKLSGLSDKNWLQNLLVQFQHTQVERTNRSIVVEVNEGSSLENVAWGTDCKVEVTLRDGMKRMLEAKIIKQVREDQNKG